MVEYGVNVTNKFGYLSDDGALGFLSFPFLVTYVRSVLALAEAQDPTELLLKAELAAKKEEKTAGQKKAERKTAQKAKKDALAAAAAAKEAESKKLQLQLQQQTNNKRECTFPSVFILPSTVVSGTREREKGLVFFPTN